MTDWSDPCAALAALRPAYYELLSGQQRTTVTFDGRSVSYTPGNIPALREEVSRLEAQCTAQTTGKPARYAMTAGTRRRWFR